MFDGLSATRSGGSATAVGSTPASPVPLDDRDAELESSSESSSDLVLRALVSLRLLQVWNNPLLVDMDGLSSLRVLNSSAIYGNPVLDHLPEAPELRRIEFMQVVGNAELRTIPAYDAGVESLPYALGGPPGVVPTPTPNPDSVYTGFGILEIGNNPKLSQFSAPARLSRGRYVGIHDNPSLTELDVGALTTVDGLSIRNNAALGSVDIGALDTVDELVVENNPALPVTGFAEVRTFTSTITGNADGP